MSDENKKTLKDYHKISNRHVLVVETNMSYENIIEIIDYSDRVRRAHNELVGVFNKKLDQLKRTKAYRNLLKQYGATKDATTDEGKEKHIEICEQLKKMQEEAHLTEKHCRKAMQTIYKKYNILAVFGLSVMEDVWKAIEKCIYGNGKTLHFYPYYKLPTMRAKQMKGAITVSVKNNKLRFKMEKLKFGIKIKDKFQQDEIDAVIYYLNNRKEIDEITLENFNNGRPVKDTYRPCYATLVPKFIRGKYRIFLHLTIEGKAKPKYDKNGNPRHKYGTGRVGIDIGTQTIAYNAASKTDLKNLAERGNSIKKSERMQRIYYRAMDRSRRANNPDNYNDDGTVKKGKKTWKESNNYKKLRSKHTNLCRKNAENRHLAINEEINYIRSFADEVVTEPQNAAKLARRAKKTTKNSKGKFNEKKRFGKSIQNRCPGYFQATIKAKFESTGGDYIEVANNYRASQYDHTVDNYIVKKLSDRLYNLRDGPEVQRDCYSAFLLYCYNIETSAIDRERCKAEFDKYYKRQEDLIKHIKTNKIKVLNSGIKVA